MIITIDGPSGTGKGSAAKLLAERLNIPYFDTGAMFRAVTLWIQKQGTDFHQEEALAHFFNTFSFEIRRGRDEQRFFVCGEEVTREIRTQEVESLVSEIAAIPRVRNELKKLQRRYGKGSSAIFEGRDMGTVVFPNAKVKFFITASPEVRAERRYLQILSKDRNSKVSKGEILKEIIRRDDYDISRDIAPLMKAEDAFLLDTSSLSLEEVVQVLEEKVREAT